MNTYVLLWDQIAPAYTESMLRNTVLNELWKFCSVSRVGGGATKPLHLGESGGLFLVEDETWTTGEIEQFAETRDLALFKVDFSPDEINRINRNTFRNTQAEPTVI